MFGRKGNVPIDFNVHATYDADEKLQECLQITDVFLICLHLCRHICMVISQFTMLQAEGDAEAQEKQRRDTEADVKTNVENAQNKQ